MFDTRGELEIETLLKLVLGLVAVLLVLEIIGAVINGLTSLLGPFALVVQFAIAVLIGLWLLDRL
ncbi:MULTISPECIES: DUF7554 family protein [Natrinema]|uniref:Uncharacterized protein n=4 Tax=Natrinema TaxID=88723 RepID=L9ZF26_NATA2|nr:MULTISPECIES: hypothetical protein [Natrinema]ELY79304.1 hypothetical protein C487_06333 [Natrinema pallidum DSM 3751]ELY84646.1 hypothetical protein C485_14850 [Natrinema altunense JCM 12890]QCW04716.1 hypothetical protein FGF80_16455 [Natrinema pallidum]RZH69070.1 hypothetical protein ELS17_06355 [Natrinema altunense]